MTFKPWLLAGAAAIGLALAAVFTQGSAEKMSEGWITGASDDAARFERIERYLRGFDQPMWEVGDRYEKIYDALSHGNYDLALYHWKKIKITIENGAMKRPGRAANAKLIFLDDTWKEVQDGFAKRETETAWQAFDLARTACMSCHMAEKVDYINDQSLFLGLTPPETH